MTSTINMPSAICLNRVGGSDRIEGFDDNNCHVGTGYVKASRAFMDIDNERQRQIGKGYDADHDDCRVYGDLASVGGYLAVASAYQSTGVDVPDGIRWECDFNDGECLIEDNPRENLIKAAALLVAEIERIDREE